MVKERGKMRGAKKERCRRDRQWTGTGGTDKGSDGQEHELDYTGSK